MSTPQERLTSEYYNSNPKTEANPGGLANNGHVDNFPAALADVGAVSKKVGDDAAVAAAAAAQSSAWLYEGTPGSVIRLSDTKIGIKGVDRTSLYLSKPNPRALRILQSKPLAILLTNNQTFNSAPWNLSNYVAAVDAVEADPLGVAGKASQLNETTSTNTYHSMTMQYAGYTANDYVMISFGLKANARSKGQLKLSNAGGSMYLTFDLSAGTVSAVSKTGTAANEVGNIFPLGNSWYRVYLGGKVSTSTGTMTAELSIANAAGALQYNGVASSGIRVWDAAFHKLVSIPAQDNNFMFVSASVWNAAANMTELTVLGGCISPNFGAYKDVNTDGLYYGQDPNNAPRAGGSAGKLYMAQNYNAIGMNW